MMNCEAYANATCDITPYFDCLSAKTRSRARSKNSPFDESKMQGRVLTTMVAGNTVYQYAQA